MNIRDHSPLTDFVCWKNSKNLCELITEVPGCGQQFVGVPPSHRVLHRLRNDGPESGAFLCKNDDTQRARDVQKEALDTIVKLC